MVHTIIAQGKVIRLFIAAIIAIIPALLPVSQGRTQDLPPYQTLEVRRLCAPTQISRTPGQRANQTGHILLNSGGEVRLVDITFGPDRRPYFAVDYATGKGLERAKALSRSKTPPTSVDFHSARKMVSPLFPRPTPAISSPL